MIFLASTCLNNLLEVVASNALTIAFILRASEPIAWAKAILHVNDVTETGVPVENDQNVVHQTKSSKHIGIVGVALSSVQERPEPVYLHQTKTPENWFEANWKVEDIER